MALIQKVLLIVTNCFYYVAMSSCCFFPSLFLFSERLNKLKIIHLLFWKVGCKLKLIFLRLIFFLQILMQHISPFFSSWCLSVSLYVFLPLPPLSFILTVEQGKFSRIKRKFDTEISHLSPALPPHMHSLLHYQQSLPEWYVCPYL